MAAEPSMVPIETLLQLVKDIHGDHGFFISEQYKRCTKTGDHFASNVSGLLLDTRVKEGEVVQNSFVVKKNPGNMMTLVLNKVTSLQFKKEGAFYREILPLLNTELKSADETSLRTPKFFHLDLAEGSELVILENMNNLGYYTLDRKESLATDAIKIVIAELARLHAASIMVQANHSVDSEALHEIYSPLLSFRDSEMFPNSYDHYADLAGVYDQPALAQFFKTNKKSSSQIFGELLKTTDKFKVINHGEPWVPNFLLKRDDDKLRTCVLIDFQKVRLGSPALDLNHLFYTCLDGEARKANIKDYLDYYYDTFVNVLKKAKFDAPFTKEELDKEYYRKNLFGYIMMIDTLYKVKCDDSDCLTVTTFISEEMYQIETRCRRYVKSRKDLMSPRLSALFSEMAENKSFQTEDIDEFMKALNEQ